MQTTDEARTVGFIGLGTIGFPMARNLARPGVEVVGYDVDDEQRATFGEAENCRTATSPADVAERARQIHVAVVNDEQLEDVAYGANGLHDALDDRTDRTVVIVHSTVSPSLCKEIDEHLPNASVVDAPVSPGALKAEAGELTIMVGGDEETVADCAADLDVLAASVHHMGPVGTGLTTKLANNLVFHAQCLATFEAVELAAAEGIDDRDLIEVIDKCSGANHVTENWAFYSEDFARDHGTGPEGLAAMSAKTLSLILNLAKEHGVSIPAAAVASQRIPEHWRAFEPRE
jgi:3-hydroxyisobutyrate dehydrogenase